MNTKVKECIIDTIYDKGYLTRAEYDEIMSQISDNFVRLSEDNDTRYIEIEFDVYYADIYILDVIDIEATLIVNQYDGYLMCEVKIIFGDETGDVVYKEVTLEGDVE